VLLGGSLVGISGISRRCGGLWRYLSIRAQGKTAVELERERNRATAEVIQLLPEGYELLECEREGRLRVIRRSVPAEDLAAADYKLPGPGGELDR
jgi:hypothetical protein